MVFGLSSSSGLEEWERKQVKVSGATTEEE